MLGLAFTAASDSDGDGLFDQEGGQVVRVERNRHDRNTTGPLLRAGRSSGRERRRGFCFSRERHDGVSAPASTEVQQLAISG